MATPTPPSTGPSIGTSRLLNINSLQQAADAFTRQINRLTSTISTAIRTSNASNNNPLGGSVFGAAWNTNSNRSTSANGGGGRFTLGGLNGTAANGGGGNFGSLAGPSRLSTGAGVALGIASGLTNYANRTMSTNMQMDYFSTYSSVAGGGGRAGWNTARNLAFNNNYAALNATDAARAAYINQYTFGNAQFNGQANPSFVSGMRQANAFGYANPTLGALGGATAAQQTYTARSLGALTTMGYQSPIGFGGVKNSMGAIASSIVRQTFGSAADIRGLKAKNIDAAFQQGGGLQVSLQALGARAGWSQNTIQEYSNVIRGQLMAERKGMSESKYYNLLGQASGGNRSAINQLAKTTNMGTSMFENQRNLNASRLTRQSDILQSLAPAFDSATRAVNKFSDALTATLKATGMDKLIGAGAGYTAPFSNALGGFSGLGGNIIGGLLGGAILRGGGGALGRAGAGLLTRGAGGAGGGIAGSAALRASGVVGAALGGGYALSKLGKTDPAGHPTKNEGFWDWTKSTFSWTGIKSTFNVKEHTRKLWEPLFGDDKPHKATFKELYNDRTTNNDGQPGGANAPVGSSGTKGGSKATGTNSGATAAQVIGLAEQQLGDPYQWGGTGPDAWDCSGLIQWAYKKAGVSIPRTSQNQQKVGKAVDLNKTQPGDLLFNGNPAHHVAMSIGNGKLIEAPHPGASVRIRSFKPGEFTNARRILGSVGNMGDLSDATNPTADTLNDSAGNSGGNLGSGYGATSELAAIMSALGGNAGGGSLGLNSQTSSSSNASTDTSSSPKAPTSNSHKELQSYAKKLLKQYGWSSQWNDFNALEMSEAGWNPKATNPSSGAYGLAQALPPGKYASAGSDWKTNGATQLRWMMGYIKDRYGSPSKAWSFHQRNNWYDKGAWDIDKDQPATVHKGEMIIPAQQAETIRQTLLNNTFNPNLQKAAGMGSGGASISFGDVNINLPSTYSGTAQEARDMGKTIVAAIDEQLRLKNLQIGQ